MLAAKLVLGHLDPILSDASVRCRELCEQEGLSFAVFAVARDKHGCNHIAAYTPEPISSEHLSTIKAQLCSLIPVDGGNPTKGMK